MSAIQPQQSGRQDLAQLSQRGVSTPQKYAELPQAVVVEQIRRFDNDSAAGVGALVFRLEQEIDKQRNPSRASRDLLAREAEYGRRLVSVLTEYFPEVCTTEWGPHPAAIAEAIRLKWVNRRLRKSDGPKIRAAVEAFNERFGIDAPDTTSAPVPAEDDES